MTMRTKMAICLLLLTCHQALGDLKELTRRVRPHELKRAKDPVTQDIVRMELEEGFRYHRHLCIYARTRGKTNHGWGYKTQVYLGVLWQYDITSTVLYSDVNYTVELLQFHAGTDSGQMLIESRKQLSESLSRRTREILVDWQDTDDIPARTEVFTAAGKALLSARFMGVPISKKQGVDILFAAKDDSIRALGTDFGLPGTQFLVIYDLANKNATPWIQRVVSEGDRVVRWEPAAAESNAERQALEAQTREMMELIQNSCMCLDSTIVPGGILYEPGASWTASARNLTPLIAPVFYRVDQARGEIEFKTDARLRSFQGTPHFKTYNTRTAANNRLLFKKQLTERDRKSSDVKRRWSGTLTLVPDRFETFIAPSGEHSYVVFVFGNGEMLHEGEESVRWWFDTEITTEVNAETLYYCKRSRIPLAGKAMYRSALSVAREGFAEFITGEDCPWENRLSPER
jgi:hypothetical protein